MSDGAGRQVYFDKHIRTQKTSQGYLEALQKSPYRTHTRMALELGNTWALDKQNFDAEVAILMAEENEIEITDELSISGIDNNSEPDRGDGSEG
jgi:hypothetical protein